MADTKIKEVETMEKDRIYLNYLGEALNLWSRLKIQYLAIILAVNLAFYGAIYLLDMQTLWILSGAKIFLLALLVFSNGVFAKMYLREHNLAENRDEALMEYLKEKEGTRGNVAYTMQADINEMDEMQGVTWESAKVLLSVLNAIPLVFFAVLIFFWFPAGFRWLSRMPFQDVISFLIGSLGFSYRDIIFAIFLLPVSFFVWVYLWIKEFKR
ncbi:hypothetical protein ACFLZ2_05880 [Candidatus Margulisiibacteriota bacterium]